MYRIQILKKFEVLFVKDFETLEETIYYSFNLLNYLKLGKEIRILEDSNVGWQIKKKIKVKK